MDAAKCKVCDPCSLSCLGKPLVGKLGIIDLGSQPGELRNPPGLVVERFAVRADSVFAVAERPEGCVLFLRLGVFGHAFRHNGTFAFVNDAVRWSRRAGDGLGREGGGC
jgi:hypothetical protein